PFGSALFKVSPEGVLTAFFFTTNFDPVPLGEIAKLSRFVPLITTRVAPAWMLEPVAVNFNLPSLKAGPSRDGRDPTTKLLSEASLPVLPCPSRDTTCMRAELVLRPAGTFQTKVFAVPDNPETITWLKLLPLSVERKIS